jgi:hypothetical protein
MGPGLGLLGQRLVEQAPQRRPDVGASGQEIRRGRLELRPHHVELCGAVEGHLTGQGVVGDDPRGVQVRALIGELVPNLLRREVTRRHQSSWRLTLRARAKLVEAQHLHPIPPVHHHLPRRKAPVG